MSDALETNRCAEVQDNRAQSAAAPPPLTPVLHWPSGPPIPLATEMAMLPLLMHWGRTERGMMRSQPAWRVGTVISACKNIGMDLAAALSLRRHHIKALHGRDVQNSAVGLGSDADTFAAAMCFEQARATRPPAANDYLTAAGVPFETEVAYRARGGGQGRGQATPDFLAHVVVPTAHGGFEARWIECKHFYGASTIAQDGASAVGKLLQTAERYVRQLGPGVMVFAHGCGEELAFQLWQRSVLVVDARPLDLSGVYSQQRTWCANAAGHILP